MKTKLSAPASLLVSLLFASLPLGACSSDDDVGSTTEAGAEAGADVGQGGADSTFPESSVPDTFSDRSPDTAREVGSDASDAGIEAAVVCSDASGPLPVDAAVEGAARDQHCTTVDGGTQSQAIGTCQATSDADGGADEAFDVYTGNEADDDDCKYHVKFESACLALHADTYFTVTLKKKADGTPVTNAGADDISIESFLTDTHPAQTDKVKAQVVSPGVYKVGPVQFDQPGNWTLRFHYFEKCSDIPQDSPHGHVAFALAVK